MTQNQNAFKQQGYIIHKLKDTRPIQLVNQAVDEVFGDQTNIQDTEQFRTLLLEAQDKINHLKVHKLLVQNELDVLSEVIGTPDISIQTVLYLRGVRPQSPENVEYLDFHRENLYCDEDYINHQVNVHIPIRNYNLDTSMLLIDESHLIPDDDLTVIKHDSQYSGIERLSMGHRLGLTYNPKEIVGGIDTGRARRLELAEDEVFIFTSRLIHGGGINTSNDVRFSLDFGLVSTDIVSGQMKKFHFGAYNQQKAHYLPLADF